MTDSALAEKTTLLLGFGQARQWRLRERLSQPYLVLGALALVLAVLVALLLRPVPPPAAPAARMPVAGVAAAPAQPVPLPKVAPVELLTVDADVARQINARVPFFTGAIPAARPYVTALVGDDLQRGVDCLAAAQVYEAGNDPEGEAAVAQVVLNRVRHPAFPHSVCAVVFQGSERRTGCQFTFACDGALVRVPRPDAWNRARTIASQMLAGRVFAPVGLATHYHTDWVVPYWSSGLDKLTAVKTHLFFRWRGGWGGPRAFDSKPNAIEPRIAKLAALSDVHKDARALDALRLDRMIAGASIAPQGSAIDLPATSDATAFPALAERLCHNRESCPGYGAAAATPAVEEVTRDASPLPADVAISGIVGAPIIPSEPVRRRRIDPCRALRSVDDRIGFCAAR